MRKTLQHKIKMKKQKGRIGFLGNKEGVSIAFSVFVVLAVIILLGIMNLAISPVIQESVKFNNQYMLDNPSKYLPEVRQNQNDAYKFFDAFSVITLITLFSWAVVNAIKREGYLGSE